MDTEDCGAAEFQACLRDLARVNRLFLAYRPTLAWLNTLLRRHGSPAPLHILDVGGGYGDMLRRIDAWAARRGIAVQMISLDMNRWARQAGEAATPAAAPVTWVTADLFDYQPDAPVDVVISSLFTHHLPDDQVVAFLRWMEAQARLGWFVNDLHRHPVPYHLFRLWAFLARPHRFVRHDGPVSIARAFRAPDWRRLIAAAGLDRDAVQIRWWMPFRLSVGRIK